MEVIKYEFASFYCNKVGIFVIWEVIKYEFASFDCNKVDIFVIWVCGSTHSDGLINQFRAHVGEHLRMRISYCTI